MLREYHRQCEYLRNWSAESAFFLLFYVGNLILSLVWFLMRAGVFVAGMDAGRAYNDFPYMAGQWIPDEYWAIRGWRGFFENTAAVQLHHRVLAGTTLVSVLTTWAMFRGRHLPRASQHLLNGLAAMTAVQVSLQDSVHSPQVLQSFWLCC